MYFFLVTANNGGENTMTDLIQLGCTFRAPF